MQTIPRIIFDRVGLKLPANAKALLNVRQMDVYDILQLLVNTVNAVVKANDGNIDKEEKFLAALNEALDNWAMDREAEIGRFKDEIMNYVISGEFDTEGFVSSPLSFETNFWNELAHGMMEEAHILAPGAEGNSYGGGDKWVVRFDMKDQAPIYLDVEMLMNNIQIDVDNTDGAVITDNNKGFEEIGRIPFATQELGGLFHKNDKAKLDGLYVDENNRLHFGEKVYKLEPYEEQPSDRTYLTPQILELSYDDIPEDGGVTRPFVQVSQQVLVGTNVQRRIFIVATYRWDAGQQRMVTTYENEDYILDGGELSLVFDFDSDSVGAEMSADGIVEYSGHATTTRTRMGTVTVQATMNGIQADEEMFADVYQEASEAGTPAIMTENQSGTAIVGLAFGNCQVDEASASKTIVVKGENLTGNITAKINNSRYQFVTEGENVDQLVIDKNEAMGAGKELQVVFIPNTTGATSNANITFTSDGAAAKVVALTGTGVRPSLTVAPTSLTFSDKAVNGSYTGTFTVRGQYLKGNIGLALTQEGAAFSIDKMSISKSEAGSAVTVTVTYAPTTVGSSSGTITITSDGAASKTVALSGNAISGVDTMTAYYGTGETLPTALGSNMFSLVSGTNTKKITEYTRVHWVAIPTSLPVVVTGTDVMGKGITVGEDSSTISGYTIYYRQVAIPIDETTFTIVV